MENKDRLLGQLADSPGEEACQKRTPLPPSQESAAAAAEDLASAGIDPTCTRSRGLETPRLSLQTLDGVVEGDLTEESKRHATMTAQQQRGPERNADDPVLDEAQAGGASSETFRTPRDETDQGSPLRLDYEELSQSGSKHPGYMDGGSSISSQDLELEHHRGGSRETYGTYISGMRSLVRRAAEQGDTGGLSEDLVASLDSNKAVPHNRTASKVNPPTSSVSRETIHQINNRPVPERTRRRLSILQLLRKQTTTRGAGGETRPSGIPSISSTGAIADLMDSESSSNRRRAGEPTRRSPTRRSSVRHLGSILCGICRRKPSPGQSSDSHSSVSAEELAG